MAFCPKCGAAVQSGAPFCSSCGAAQPGVGAAAPGPSVSPGPPVTTAGMQQTQMAENVAALLCYLVGWITGIVFFLIDKRPFVRFHATQSIVVFGGLQIVGFVVGIIFGISVFGGIRTMSFGWALYSIVDLLMFVLWIVLMIKAYQGERFRVPIAADLAEQLFGKS
jgi:uncharacterized membrane protein